MKLKLLCLISLAAGSLSATELTQIYLGKQASRPEIHAAEELRSALQKITGKNYSVTRSDNVPAGGALVLGTPESSPAVRTRSATLQLDGDKEETIAIRTIDGNLYLAGNMPRGVLFAVYQYLQDKLGVRWWKPGSDGEEMPRREAIELPQLKIRYCSPFHSRSVNMTGQYSDPETELWLVRNFINSDLRDPELLEKTGTIRTGGGHSVALYDVSMRKTHPEYYAFRNGKRDLNQGYMGCWSNPGFHQYMLKKHLEIIDKERLDVMSIYPADVGYYCTCPDCVAIDSDPSTRWFKYYSKLTSELKKLRPNVVFGSIAYQYYSTPPKMTVDRQLLQFIRFCQYDRCNFHPLSAPCNEGSMKKINEWLKCTDVGIYGYHFDMFLADTTWLSAPFWKIFQDELQTFRKMGIRRVLTELPIKRLNETYAVRNQFDRLGFSPYAYVQLLWNPDADLDSLLDQWCRFSFGPAAECMHRYFDMQSSRWSSMKEHQHGYWWFDSEWTASEFLSPEYMKEADALLSAALKAAGSEKRYSGNIIREMKLFNEWVQYYYRARAALSIFPDRKQQIPGMKDAEITYDENALYAAAEKAVTMELRTAKGVFTFSVSGGSGHPLRIPFEKYGIQPQERVSAAIRLVRQKRVYPCEGFAPLHFAGEKQGNRKMVWIMPENVPNNRNLFVSRFAGTLLSDSWSY